MSRHLIFANGDPNDGAMVQRALRHAQECYVWAADGGARVARYYGLRVQAVVGDMDSLPATELARLEADGARVYRYPAEKNETDLELCLQHAVDAGATWIRIIGGVGGRFDQVMGNVFLMALPFLSACDVEMVAGNQAIRLLWGDGAHSFEGEVGDTVSLIPLVQDVTHIRTQGLRYALDDETLYFGKSRGISNELVAPLGVVAHEGALLLVHTVGKAD
jgi:thiamine pyrophosphokinase